MLQKLIIQKKNINMRLKFLFLVLINLVIITGLCYGQKQQPKKSSSVVKNDTSKVDVRKIDSAAVKSYSKQKDFIYDDVPPDSLSLWDRFWNWLWNLLGKAFSGKLSGTLVKYILIGLVVAIVVFLIIKLAGLDYKVLAGKSKSLDIPFEETLDNIHEINFDEQLAQALQSNNYRLAVRLLYLKTLKHLSDQKMINWLPEKTNQTYVNEIHNVEKKQVFANLTLQFEYIWYGDFSIDKNEFESINQSFKQFNSSKA